MCFRTCFVHRTEARSKVTEYIFNSEVLSQFRTHSLTSEKVDRGLKNSFYELKKWCYDFFVFRFRFYVKNCARSSTGVVETRGDCALGWIGNKNLVTDWHASVTKYSGFKSLNLLGGGRWEAETCCEPCHVRGIYHHGGAAVNIGYFCLSTLLTTLLWSTRIKSAQA